jgi:hypothetical protein
MSVIFSSKPNPNQALVEAFIAQRQAEGSTINRGKSRVDPPRDLTMRSGNHLRPNRHSRLRAVIASRQAPITLVPEETYKPKVPTFSADELRGQTNTALVALYNEVFTGLTSPLTSSWAKKAKAEIIKQFTVAYQAVA